MIWDVTGMGGGVVARVWLGAGLQHVHALLCLSVFQLPRLYTVATCQPTSYLPPITYPSLLAYITIRSDIILSQPFDLRPPPAGIHPSLLA